MLGNPALGFLPLGFVDDEAGLSGAEVQGYPVHGGNGELDGILERLAPSDLVLAVPGAAPEQRDALARTCAQRGVRLVTFDVQWTASL
jgi:FlaA1/EpsC-like NDP-sugar epimerase